MKKLSLQKLSQNELEKREMNQLVGGGPGACGCGCNYVATEANASANLQYGYTQSSGGTNYCACGGEYNGETVRASLA